MMYIKYRFLYDKDDNYIHKTLELASTFSSVQSCMIHAQTFHTDLYTFAHTVLNTLDLVRSCQWYKQNANTYIARVPRTYNPTWYLVENKEVPDHNNIGVPPVRKYANCRTLGGGGC